jgi:adenylate kinase family enzyme
VGKTTFARRLAERLAMPHIELDALYWKANWVPRAPAAFRSLVEEAIAGGRWALDGNYSAVRDLIWSRATSVIWLDYGFPRVVWQVLARTLGRTLRREELFGGNRESLRSAFLSRDSILLWAVTTFHRRRRQYRALFDARTFPHLTTIEFQEPGEAEAFLRAVPPENLTGLATQSRQ